MPASVPSSYYDLLARIESGGNPFAKAPTSSASGLFQFTKSTATKLGLPWGSDPSQPFGGADVSVDQQHAAAQTLTQGNANTLANAGIPVNNATLYAAHFLGAGQAISVLGANPNLPLSSLVSAATIKANSFLKGMSAGDFGDWLSGKTGGAGSSGGTFQHKPVQPGRPRKP